MGEYGDQTTQRQLLCEMSPIHKLDRVVTPLLVMHGAKYTNVPVVEAEQVEGTLKQRGGDRRLRAVPDEEHGFRDQKTV